MTEDKKQKSKPLRVAACIIQREGKFLITKRPKYSHLGHLWEFPGGKIEPGETPEECAVRECEEEIGVEVRPKSLLAEVDHAYPEVRVHLYFILCQLVSGEPRPIECADLAWVLPSEFSRYEFPAADRRVIAHYIEGEPSVKVGK